MNNENQQSITITVPPDLACLPGVDQWLKTLNEIVNTPEVIAGINREVTRKCVESLL